MFIKSIVCVAAVLVATPLLYAQVGVDTTTPHASSVLDLTSTTQGVLIPRMTTAQRTAISAPATSLLVYDTTVGAFFYYTGTTVWTTLDEWATIAGGISYAGQVAVNTTTPNSSAAMEIVSTDKGLLIPRLTTAQRTAIVSPAASLLVYDVTLSAYYYYTGSAWTKLDAWTPVSGGVSYAGQVGVNTTSPNASAAMEVTSTTKGVMIPRMTSAERLAIASPATALLVFDTTEGAFYFYTGTQWSTLNSFIQNSGSTTATHNGNVVINGTLTATNINGVNSVPTGGIIMWTGTTPPSGWALCDGTNGTPNLKGKFIVGYDPSDTDYNAVSATSGKTGGAKTHTITAAELPAHTHNYYDIYFVGNNNPLTKPLPNTSYETLSTTYTGDDGNDSDNNIVVKRQSASENNATSNTPFDNRPPYYVLAFIMKL